QVQAVRPDRLGGGLRRGLDTPLAGDDRQAAGLGDADQVAVVLVAEDLQAPGLGGAVEGLLAPPAGLQGQAAAPLVGVGLGRGGRGFLEAGDDGQHAALADVDQVAVVLVQEDLDAPDLGVLVPGLLTALADLEVQAVDPLGGLGAALGLVAFGAGGDADGARLGDVDPVAVVLVAEDLQAEHLGLAEVLHAGGPAPE